MSLELNMKLRLDMFFGLRSDKHFKFCMMLRSDMSLGLNMRLRSEIFLELEMRPQDKVSAEVGHDYGFGHEA